MLAARIFELDSRRYKVHLECSTLTYCHTFHMYAIYRKPVNQTQSNITHYNNVEYDTKYNMISNTHAVQYSTIQYIAVQCNAIQYNTVQCNTL